MLSSRSSSRPTRATRRIVGVLSIAGMVSGLVTGVISAALVAGPATATPGWPTSPTTICGNTTLLAGPQSQEEDWIAVAPGNLAGLVAAPGEGRTFYLAAGVHTLGEFLTPRDDDTFIGAPGAVLDGGRTAPSAFTGNATGVTIRYLTIQHFGPVGSNQHQGVVNQGGGHGWTIDHNTIQENAGAGILMSDGNVVEHNCLARNGQYGINVYEYGGVVDITVDSNELASNHTDGFDDWTQPQDPNICGCSGGIKFWETTGATVTNNYVHDNKGVGIWPDTNNIGFTIEHNWVEDNEAEGIFYEISYNAKIRHNTLVHNAWTKGAGMSDGNGNAFPGGAIYISESGGDARANNAPTPAYSPEITDLEVSDNFLDDNWGGIILFESADRYCASISNQGGGACTRLGDDDPVHPAYSPTHSQCAEHIADNLDGCRWKTQNVSVHDNLLRKLSLGCPSAGCGQSGIQASPASPETPERPANPYYSESGLGSHTIQDAITFRQNNHFTDNTYVGDWSFNAYEGRVMGFPVWRGQLFQQDAGSTMNESLDADTSGLEGTEPSTGEWAPWFSATASQTTEQAHTGTHSLKVGVTAPYGWGVQLENWPGFPAGPGAHAVSFWARAGSGTGLAATMTVKWGTDDGTVLQTDTVTSPTLTSTWVKSSETVTAPTGTTRVHLEVTNGAGVAGNSLYLDDFGVGEPQFNTFEPRTAGLEGPGSIGRWAPWYDAAPTQSTAQAHTGTHSLRVDVTGQFWGVQLDNSPGFSASAGIKTFGFWVKAGAGSIPEATLTLTWYGLHGNLLQTDTVAVPVGSGWAEATATTTAPAGTGSVSATVTDGASTAGGHLFLDDFFILDAGSLPPPPNALDADTAGLEASIGHWDPWFSATAAQSTEQAHTGTHSLKVGVTAPYGWGVQLDNWPGFSTTPGSRTVSFWGRSGTGSGIGATMTVKWRQDDGTVLQTDTVGITTLTGTWTEASATFTAPAGTTKVHLEVTNSPGVAGDSLYLDDFSVS